MSNGPSSREIQLEQALIAVLAELQLAGRDVQSLIEKVEAGLIGNAIYRHVGNSHVTGAADELKGCYESAKKALESK